MKTLKILESKVYIGTDAFAQMSVLSGCRAVIISNTTVFSLYSGKLAAALDIPYTKFILPDGEAEKSIENVLKICEYLSAVNFTRGDVIIALGGGVITDISAFTASVYKRGVRLIHVPTTLLCAVDASIGAKTAVNTPFGKNIIGTFYEPEMIICDTSVFLTLPESEIKNAYAEIIKYDVLENALLTCISNTDELVYACASIKKKYVEADKLDYGIRRMLNLGHTVGHAIEALSRYSVPHGNAVSIGLSVFGNEKIKQQLEKRGLPLTCPYSADELIEFIHNDKKCVNGKISMTVPLQYGNCVIREYTFEQLKSILESRL